MLNLLSCLFYFFFFLFRLPFRVVHTISKIILRRIFWFYLLSLFLIILFFIISIVRFVLVIICLSFRSSIRQRLFKT